MSYSRSIFILSLIGVAVSSVALYNHVSTAPSSYCNFGGSFSCDLVNRSIYSSIFGIPVALLGIVAYAAIAVMSRMLMRHALIPRMLAFAAVLGVFYSLYLTYLEAFVLAAWCILCITSLGLISGIAILSVAQMIKGRKASPPHFQLIML